VPVLAVESLAATRIVARPTALQAAAWPPGTIVLPIAPDEALIIGDMPADIDDPHAIIEDEGGFVVLRLSRTELDEWMSRQSEWTLPRSPTSFSQGMVAGLPAKIWVDGDLAMVLTRVSLRAELEGRL
jgi:hypothetical protein